MHKRMNVMALAALATVAAPDHHMGAAPRPGKFPGITFEPDNGDGATSGGANQPEIKGLDEAVSLFEQARAEYHEQKQKDGQVAQELKNNLDALQTQLDKLEAKAKRPVLDGMKNASGIVTPDSPEFKAYDAFLRKGQQRMAAEGAADELKYLSVADDAGGGYLAPVEFVNEILKETSEVSEIRKVAKTRRTSQKAIVIPTRTALPSASWVGEGGQASSSQGAYGAETIHAHPLVAVVVVSAEALEDSAFNLAAEIQGDAAEQFAVSEGAAFVTGDANKKPEGLLTNASVAARTVKSGHATTLNSGDALIRAFYAVKTGDARQGTWAMNRQTLREVRLLKDSNGQFLWQANIGLVNTPPAILERPYIECPDMAAPSAAGAYTTGQIAIAFGNFGRGYLVLDRTVMAVVRDDLTLADQGLVKFIVRKRVGGQVIRPEAFYLVEIGT